MDLDSGKGGSVGFSVSAFTVMRTCDSIVNVGTCWSSASNSAANLETFTGFCFPSNLFSDKPSQALIIPDLSGMICLGVKAGEVTRG
ncbi:rCG19983, isoform CRA_a [Rattus norvegicus]|uniref:RCG19983, isoform CRA_a n=1 Tax=Rattus norvegicus TaxID=10116 RepID=A6KIH4_RAT|nr:rCG19983, isoform CRA_a [Rattus norvegicus]EDL87829.1 rCG19983, isoform CRA_a [Rattus norvegicus]